MAISPKSCAEHRELSKKRQIEEKPKVKMQHKIVLGTVVVLIVTTIISIWGYSAFPALQSQILFLLIVFSAWTSVLALFWALYAISNFYSKIDEAKDKLKMAQTQLPAITKPILTKLLEFEQYWNGLPVEKRESMANSLNLVLDLLWAKLKQLEKRGW